MGLNRPSYIDSMFEKQWAMGKWSPNQDCQLNDNDVSPNLTILIER